MAFIELEDYSITINEEELDVISGKSTVIREKAEKSAISQIKEILSRTIDVEYEFSKTGESRNQALLTYTIYFTLYILYGRIAKDRVPDDRYDQYKLAKEFFYSVRDDLITTTLKRKTNDCGEDESPAVRTGGNQKNEHHY